MEKAKMDQLKNYEQVRYSSVETRNQGLGSVNQWTFQDPGNQVNTNIRPPDLNFPVGARSDLNLPVGVRPVLNYSIQTGEEFALEFMRERAYPWQHVVSNSTSEPNNATKHMDTKGPIGIFHTGSDSGLDTSTICAVENRGMQDPRSNTSSLNEDKVHGQPFQSVNRSSSQCKSDHGFRSQNSSRASGRSSKSFKLLCSFGGKLLPRPSDGRLRYVGGETRILRISKDISWEELVQKTWTMYNQPHAIKYQLPDEDLDALVSVSCDEDLQNMIEECNVLEHGGPQKLRMFLISNDDLNDSQLGPENVEGDPEFQYVVAVNGMDFGSRRNSIAMENTSGNNLEELLGLSVERETGVALAMASSAHPEAGMPFVNQSSHMVLPTLSQPELHQSSTFHCIHSFPDADYKSNIPQSVPVQYDSYSSHPSNLAPVAENMIPRPVYGHMDSKGAIAVGQPHTSLKAKVPEVSTSQMLVKTETIIAKKVDNFKDQYLGRDSLQKDAKMTEENSIPKIDESDKIQQSVKNEKIVSSYPHDSSSLYVVAQEDASITGAAADTVTHVVQTTGSEKSQDSMSSVPLGTVNDGNMKRIDGDDQFYTTGKAFVAVHGDSEAYSANYEPEVLPQSLFRSERIPREQTGLNRLTRSDDRSGSQFPMTHAHSNVSQQMTESIDKLNDWNVASQTKEFLPSAKPVPTNPPAIEEKSSEFQKSTTVPDHNGAMNFSVRENNVESNLQKPDIKAVVLPDRDSSPSNFPMTTQGSTEYPKEESASNLTNIPWGKISGKHTEEQPPLSGGENRAVTYSQGKASSGIVTSEQGNTIIDINDRFPRDLWPDIFSEGRVIDSSTGIAPLQRDGTGLSLNMEHEPKHWSYFQKLAKDDFTRKEVSLMDQDHLSSSSPCANIGEVVESIENSFPLSRASTGAVDHVSPQSNFEDNIQQQPSTFIRPDTMNLPSDNYPSQISGVPSQQVDSQMDSRAPDFLLLTPL